MTYNGLQEIWQYMGMRLLPILEEWRVRGVNVDLRKSLLYEKVAKSLAQQTMIELHKITGEEFNWQSTKQVKELFYDKWKLPPQRRRNGKDWKVTTNKDARAKLERWINQYEYRKKQHPEAARAFALLSKFHEKKKFADYFHRISPDGLLHVYWKEHGADTLRLSSVPNIQNWPTSPIAEGLGSPRSVVVPDNPERDILISTDWSQIELWTYATLFNMKNLLEVFHRNEYVYGIIYEEVLREKFFQDGKAKVKANKLPHITDQRLHRAKAIPLGFQYGRGGRAIAEEHGWTEAEGLRYQKSWYQFVPELSQAHAKIKYEVIQKGVLRPPPGVLLHFPQFTLSAYAAYGQTPAACILRETLVLLQDLLKGYNTRTMLCVHDSILLNVKDGRVQPEKVVKVVEDVVKPVMGRKIEWLNNFQFKSSMEIGGNWDWEMEDYEEWKRRQ